MSRNRKPLGKSENSQYAKRKQSQIVEELAATGIKGGAIQGSYGFHQNS
jgi:hypothetical protein